MYYYLRKRKDDSKGRALGPEEALSHKLFPGLVTTGVFLDGFQSCLGLETPFFLFSSCWKEDVCNFYPMPALPLYLGTRELVV